MPSVTITNIALDGFIGVSQSYYGGGSEFGYFSYDYMMSGRNQPSPYGFSINTAYVRFNIGSSVPSGAIITGAELRLRRDNAGYNASLVVFRAGGAWSSSTKLS